MTDNWTIRLSALDRAIRTAELPDGYGSTAIVANAEKYYEFLVKGTGE